MKRAAIINDLSGLGKCSLAAALPVISAMGVQACPVPTAVLSNQTGYPSFFCDDFTDRMGAYRLEWEKRGFRPDCIATGYLAGEKQVEEILCFLRSFAGGETIVLVDPVMGDQGRVYAAYTEGLRAGMSDLVSCADIITPNLTEALLLLYGNKGMEQRWQSFQSDQMNRAERMEWVSGLAHQLQHRYGLKGLVITGVEFSQENEPPQLGNLILDSGRTEWVLQTKMGGSYSGTGDLFSAVLAGGLTRGMNLKDCVTLAAEFLAPAIRQALEEDTDRNDGVCFEPYLGILIRRCIERKDKHG